MRATRSAHWVRGRGRLTTRQGDSTPERDNRPDAFHLYRSLTLAEIAIEARSRGGRGEKRNHLTKNLSDLLFGKSREDVATIIADVPHWHMVALKSLFECA